MPSPDVPRDRRSMSPPPPGASTVGRGIDSPPQPQHHEEGSESGSELDSPPRITFLAIQQDEEPEFPTSPSYSPSGLPIPSPPGSPPLFDVNPAGPPKYSSSDEEDGSLVDNFVSSDDDIDCKAHAQQKCVLYAESALKHYNNDEKKEVKYELISGIACSEMLDEKGCYGHANFTAKGNQHNSKEELFFAELRWDGDTPVTTCVVSLEGEKHTGGLRDSKYDKFYLDVLPYDAKNCYACDRPIRHPKNGELYEMGHVAMSQHYI
ncbi:unnamed protein product [Urochloa humidicola]